MNPRHSESQSDALPAELPRLLEIVIIVKPPVDVKSFFYPHAPKAFILSGREGGARMTPAVAGAGDSGLFEIHRPGASPVLPTEAM